MKHEIPEELISAYLDGELTSDEQILVEQALDENPQSRQLLEDLQSLHDRLQSIPRSEPSRDYTQQILQRAERAILTGQPSVNENLSDPPATTADNTVVPTVQVVDRTAGPRNWQHLIWASTVLAATLLLALLFRPRAEVVQQLTDATGEQSNQAPSTDSTNDKGADNSLSGKTELTPNKSRQQPDLGDTSSTRDRNRGLAYKDLEQDSSADKPADSALLENAEVMPGLATASQENDHLDDADDEDHSFVYYVAVSQNQFNNKEVFQTLLDHQVAVVYDPALQNDFRSRSQQLTGADEEALEVAEAKADKRPAAKATEGSRDPAAIEKKVLARSSSQEQFGQPKRSASYRVLTIEGTPATLGPLFQELANRNQLQSAKGSQEDKEFQDRRLNQRASLSSVNQETRQRLQSLSRRDTPLPATKSAGLSAAKVPQQPAPQKPATQRKEKPSAPAGKKQSEKSVADKANQADDAKSKETAKNGRRKADRATAGLDQLLLEEEDGIKGRAGRSITTVRIVVVVIPQHDSSEAAGGQAGAAAKPNAVPAKKDKQPK